MEAAERQARNKQLGEVLGWTELWDTGNGNVIGIPPGDFRAAVVPDWYGSVDACLAVLPEDECSVDMLSLWEGCFEVVVCDYRRNVNSRAYKGVGATRAEALANAVLKWALAQQAAQP